MINIAIGTEEKTKIPLRVLIYSILKHTKEKITFTPMEGNSWTKRLTVEGTGFSLQRWFIPEFFEYEEKVIYLDVDMLCFKDISELYNTNLGEASIACTYQKDKWFNHAPATSCMVIDCKKAKTDWHLNNVLDINKYLEDDKDRHKYVKLMHAGCCRIPPKEINIAWNRFNKYIPNSTNILHYTEEPKQPWYYPQHPFKNIWRDYFIGAIKEGVIKKEDILEEVNNYRPHTCCERGQGLNPYWKKFAK